MSTRIAWCRGTGLSAAKRPKSSTNSRGASRIRLRRSWHSARGRSANSRVESERPNRARRRSFARSQGARDMQPPKPSVTVIPQTARFHFAFTLEELSAIKAATAYFAAKLVRPDERERAQRALAVLDAPLGYDVPSELGAATGGARDAKRGLGALGKMGAKR